MDLGSRVSASENPSGTNRSPGMHVGCNILSEADVRWMIHMCGGSVKSVIIEGNFETLFPQSENNSRTNRNDKIHLTLSLRRAQRDRQKGAVSVGYTTATGNTSDSPRVLSLSWLLDAICNQCPRSLDNCPPHFFL